MIIFFVYKVNGHPVKVGIIWLVVLYIINVIYIIYNGVGGGRGCVASVMDTGDRANRRAAVETVVVRMINGGNRGRELWCCVDKTVWKCAK